MEDDGWKNIPLGNIGGRRLIILVPPFIVGSFLYLSLVLPWVSLGAFPSLRSGTVDTSTSPCALLPHREHPTEYRFIH